MPARIMKINIVLKLVFLVFVSGCGIKGDPLPPSEQQTVQMATELVPATNTKETNPKPAIPKKVIKKVK